MESTKAEALHADAGALHSMLENVPVNIIVADLDCEIVYVNRASLETLGKIEHLLPIPVKDLVGTSIDRFHKNPAMQRALLADPSRMPHHAIISLGEEKLSLLATAVHNAEGEYIGAMATWELVTEKLKQEAELAEAREREKVAAEILSEKVDEILGVVTQAADGDLTRRVEFQGEDAVGQLADGLGRLLESLCTSISEIADNATTLASASEELYSTAELMSSSSQSTSAQAGSVAEASKMVGEHVHTVASGTEQMSLSITEISRNTASAAEVARDAVSAANDAGVNIQKLSASSTEIGKVVKVITNIAEQTNLLALNATIEAARAGEAGKGFAVVANEVKELAKETAKATEDIGLKISTIQSDAGDAVGAIERISGIIDQINDAQNTIASAVEEQDATTNEMVRSVKEANQGTQDIVSNINLVTEAALDSARSASGVQSAASELAKMATTLQELVTRFRYS